MSDEWFLTGFYGNPKVARRQESWSLLRRLSVCQIVPWLVFGDFNEVVCDQEKHGVRIRLEQQMTEFRQALEDCALIDLGFSGPMFT